MPDVTVQQRARAIRRRVLEMVSGRGEGYVGQGLGVADILAALYFGELQLDPADPEWAGRDRFILSTGHYVVGQYAALAELGYLDDDRLAGYAADGDDALPASTHHEVPGVESTTGSLGQGIGLAAGMALAARIKGETHRVFVLTSDGELQEGSTWETAMFAAHRGLDNLVAMVDLNRTQADGDLGQVLEVEPVAAKWAAFGWDAHECDGNDADAVAKTLAACRAADGRPKVVVFRTRLGAGVPLIEQKERAHFVRVAPEEWALAQAQLDEGDER